MTTTYSSHTLEQAIAHNLLVVSEKSSLRDVVRLINQAHHRDSVHSRQLGERTELPISCVSCVLVMVEARLVGILTEILHHSGKGLQRE